MTGVTTAKKDSDMSSECLRVVGLDLSLTSTGLSDGQSVHAISTGTQELLEARLDRLVRGVVSFVLSTSHPNKHCADLVVIEGSSYGSRGPGHEELAALRIMVRHRLWRMGVPYAIVPPRTLKRYTTGSGTATKQQMVCALYGRHGLDWQDVKVKDGRYDQADAFALAAMGYHHVGQQIGWIGQGKPAPHRLPVSEGSLDAVTWPPLLSDDA